MKRLSSCKVAFIAILSFALQAQGAVFTNGSFEIATIGEGSVNGATVETGITGWTWTMGAGESGWYDTDNDFFGLATGTDGNAFLAFNSSNAPSGGSIAQTFDTVIGTQYEVLFDIGVLDSSDSNPDPAGIVGLRASVDAAGATDVDTTFAVDAAGEVNPAAWTTGIVLSFTASDTSTVLTFSDVSTVTEAADVLLDNVSLTVVPEPSTYALLAGALALGAVMVRRRLG